MPSIVHLPANVSVRLAARVNDNDERLTPAAVLGPTADFSFHYIPLGYRTFARFMCKSFFRIFLLAASLFVVFGCKTPFEEVRTSGDPERILKAAGEYYEEGKYAKAQTLYELVVNALRGDARLEESYFKYAKSYYLTEQYILASYYFKNFSEQYPVSEQRNEAQFMEAMSYVKLSPDFRLDQEYTNKAILALEQYINTYPETERMTEINGILDELRVKLEAKAYDAARLYFDMEQYQSAVQAFERVLQDYPDSDQAQEIRFRIADSYIRWADNSVVAKRRERYESAVDNIDLYLKKYPKGDYARSLRADRNRINKLLKSNETYVRY